MRRCLLHHQSMRHCLLHHERIARACATVYCITSALPERAPLSTASRAHYQSMRHCLLHHERITRACATVYCITRALPEHAPLSTASRAHYQSVYHSLLHHKLITRACATLYCITSALPERAPFLDRYGLPSNLLGHDSVNRPVNPLLETEEFASQICQFKLRPNVYGCTYVGIAFSTKIGITCEDEAVQMECSMKSFNATHFNVLK